MFHGSHCCFLKVGNFILLLSLIQLAFRMTHAIVLLITKTSSIDLSVRILRRYRLCSWTMLSEVLWCQRISMILISPTNLGNYFYRTCAYKEIIGSFLESITHMKRSNIYKNKYSLSELVSSIHFFNFFENLSDKEIFEELET